VPLLLVIFGETKKIENNYMFIYLFKTPRGVSSDEINNQRADVFEAMDSMFLRI
jgi:hypothetical protein